MAVSQLAVLRSGFWVLSDDTGSVPGGGDQNPPPPPPGGTGMLIGASASTGSASAQATFNAENGKSGPWTVARAYNSGEFATNWNADVGAWTNGKMACVYSCKPDLLLIVANTPAGAAYRAKWRSFILSIRDDAIVHVECWHELDVKLRQGDYPWTSLTAAQIAAGKTMFYQIVCDAQKTHVKTTLIVTSFSVTGGVSTGHPADFWVGPTGADRIIHSVGFDVYKTSNGVRTGAQDLAGCYAFTRSMGAALGMGEVGIHTGATDYTQVADWMASIYAYAAANGSGPHSTAAYLCWFNTTNGASVPVPAASPLLQAASKAISQAGLIDWTKFRL